MPTWDKASAKARLQLAGVVQATIVASVLGPPFVGAGCDPCAIADDLQRGTHTPDVALNDTKSQSLWAEVRLPAGRSL